MWNPAKAIEIAIERKIIMNFLKKYWGTIAAIAVPLIGFLEPSIHLYISQNPHAFVALVMGALLTLYHSSAPKDKKVKDDAKVNP